MKKLLVIGGGGHARVVLDAIERGRGWRAAGVIDPALPKDAVVQGVRALGGDGVLPRLRRKGFTHCILAVGGADDPNLRPRLARALEKLGFSFAAVVHPQAAVSRHALIGPGVFVGPLAVVNAGARVGAHAIVNSGAIVEHDCRVGDFAHVAPGAVLGGAVAVGNNALVGIGASVRPGVKIGAGALVGAGSAVVADIPPGAVAYGAPCRPVKRKK